MNFKLKQKIVLAIFTFLLVFVPLVSKAADLLCGCASSWTILATGYTNVGSLPDEKTCDQACANAGKDRYCYGLSPHTPPCTAAEVKAKPNTTPTPSLTPTPASTTPPATTSSNVKYPYTPMEEIPGFTKTGDSTTYILQLYQFGLWTIGIAAVFMISIGAFMYITSAGNTSQMGKAKEIIFDAIIGVILALTSYILLSTINPALVQIGGGDYSTPGGSGTGGTGGGGTGGGGTGSCQVAPSGPCSVANLKNTCFGENAAQASAICFAESGGVTDIPSGGFNSAPTKGDKCQPGGESVSWGLFQINISANNLTGSDCQQKTCANSAASPTYTGPAPKYNPYCTTQANYNACVNSTKNAACNIETACALSGNGTHWGKWGANKTCGFPK